MRELYSACGRAVGGSWYTTGLVGERDVVAAAVRGRSDRTSKQQGGREGSSLRLATCGDGDGDGDVKGAGRAAAEGNDRSCGR